MWITTCFNNVNGWYYLCYSDFGANKAKNVAK